MEVPLRLRRERLAQMLEALKRAGIEATLADGSRLDPEDSPGIEAKVRLRRASPLAQNVMFGYEIVASLPSGGMSECFKVRKDGVLFFLKKARANGRDLDALRREQQNYEKLERAGAEHVLRVHDWIKDGDTFALVTEFADGGTLAEHVEARNASGFDPLDAKLIALAVLGGLRELHAVQLVHRDLKPENVLRCGDRWKLSDFGISKNLARLVTQGHTFQRAGTPGYAPPEQWAGETADPHMDVYAFGKLLVFLLSAQTDIDKALEPASWARLARRCAAFAREERPNLDEITAALNSL